MAIKIKNWLRKSSKKSAGFRKPGVNSRLKEDTVAASKFMAVAISSGLNDCCREVKALNGKRFLVRNAPILPLAGCEMAECQCRYVRFNDRRQEPRRDSEYGIKTSFVRDIERRVSRRGRRKTDV